MTILPVRQGCQAAAMGPKVVFLMADYGNDPTETAVPFTVFREAGYEIAFATEKGEVPRCDKRMIEGWTQKILVSFHALPPTSIAH